MTSPCEVAAHAARRPLGRRPIPARNRELFLLPLNSTLEHLLIRHSWRRRWDLNASGMLSQGSDEVTEPHEICTSNSRGHHQVTVDSLRLFRQLFPPLQAGSCAPELQKRGGSELPTLTPQSSESRMSRNSSSVVSGEMIANRRTGSPSWELATTNARCSSSSASDHLW